MRVKRHQRQMLEKPTLFRAVAVALALVLQLSCGAESERPNAPAIAAVETPAPGGEHGVGRRQGLTGADGAQLPLIAYYPADAEPALSAAARMPSADVNQLTRRFGAEAAMALAQGRGYAVADAPVAAGRWPVLVFAPGWGLAAYDYRALLEDIASRGFVVLAIERTQDEGRPPYEETAAQIDAAVGAVRALAANPRDAFARALDSARIGAFGHSVGGAAAALAASQNSAIGAVANLDGDFGGRSETARPGQPMFYLISDDPREPARTMERRAHIWARVSADSDAAISAQARVLRHFNFLDAALVQAAIPADRRAGRFGEIDAARGLAISGALTAAFFDEQLRGRGGAFVAALGTTPEAMPGVAVAITARGE